MDKLKKILTFAAATISFMLTALSVYEAVQKKDELQKKQ